MPVKVTVYDTERPSTTLSNTVIEDDYVITAADSAYVSHVSAYPNGTHVITVRRPDQKRPGPILHIDYPQPEPV